MSKALFAAMVVLFGAGVANAEVKTQVIEYQFEGTTLKGFLAYDDASDAKRPGVLVVHEWWGLNDYARDRAKQLAALGYVAFCVDMYGDGRTTEHPEDAGKFAGEVRKNLKTWLGRAEAGLKTLKAQPQCDADKVAAIGYCFGGSTALQLAFNGAKIQAAVAFHAGLPTPSVEQAKRFPGRILVCHGAEDSFIPKTAIDQFRKTLDEAGTKYQFESYPGAVHSFTVPGAEKKKITGIAYNEAADKKSWQQMRDLFKEVLGK